MSKVEQNTGKVSQVIGVVVDVEFPEGSLPAIFDALELKLNEKTITLEVAGHIDRSTVRAIAMTSTDGLKRGDKVTATGAPISVPIGEETLGRMFDVTGKPIDGKEDKFKNRAPIHKDPPSLTDQSGEVEVLETGIKTIDLICPVAKGGKVGLFGGAGVETQFLLELAREPEKETIYITKWQKPAF